MNEKTSKFLFDKGDHRLIGIVNEVLASAKFARRFYYPYFHPHGIKEMSETKGLRIAYAVIHLLSSLERGEVEDRINALRSLRKEVIDTAEGPMPKNTARVLLQIMKDLARSHGNYRRQLELAHDFRSTASGKPRIVREQLLRYHLLEMPEDWNQVAFDDHVHDANTKGRKSSTHLIMDAWIKGIRRLRVIHYNYIEPRFAAELMEAARILDIDIRIGIEYAARFRDKYVQLIWTPRGFTDAQSFLCFLAEPAALKIMESGREVSKYQQKYVMALLDRFNQVHRPEINETYGIELSPIDEDRFLAFVGIGQKSRLHLAKFIHEEMILALRSRAGLLQKEFLTATPQRREEITRWIENMNHLDLEAVVDDYLEPERNPGIVYPDSPRDDSDVPEMLRLSPCEILNRLAQLHTSYRVTLNLTDLQVHDVLELLYDCQGMITRLEIFNLKDWAAGKTAHIPEINLLQQAINEASAIRLKQIIREIIDRLEDSHQPHDPRQVEKLTSILHDIDSLRSYYAGKPLKARMGSDSTGRSPKMHGMGLTIIDTLNRRAQRQIARDTRLNLRETIPFTITAYRTIVFIPANANGPFKRILDRFFARFAGLRWLGYSRQVGWQVNAGSTRMTASGNIVTLGGAQKETVNGISLEAPKETKRFPSFHWSYLSSNVKNTIKLVTGFIPAFLTFVLTQDWWVIAYLGAFIWFGITGLRNVLQSILGGGGFRRSPLLHWNDYISWTRITDSLLFTGFSVPLLDYLVKTVILDRGLGITIASSPWMLYSFMALANGLYLSTHNAFRGLPKGAVFGNFFRSILSIPLAVALNTAVGSTLSMAGVVGIDGILQKWAAIISKGASDFVAGIIEGTADRYNNIRMRFRAYRNKFGEMLDIYARLELLFPEIQTFKILGHSAGRNGRAHAEAKDLEKIILIHALDFLSGNGFRGPSAGLPMKSRHRRQTQAPQGIADSNRREAIFFRGLRP
jgi:hypothetical protein